MNPVLLHKETKEYAYPLSRKEVFLKLACPTAEVSSASVIYWKRFRQATRKSKRMNPLSFAEGNRYFVAAIGFNDTIRYFQYIFEVSFAGNKRYFSPEGLSVEFPKKAFEFEGVLPDDVFLTPETFEGNIGYHIFTDRFANGDPTNDPASKVAWDAKPTRDNFFGGDLKGVEKKLPYLQDIGVTTLFLTPIFEAKSNHKYDTIDYFKIDPSFGTIEDFHSLIQALHHRGMKLVLDGVFNHIGFYSRQFQDVLKFGKKSPYWNWFFIQGEKIEVDKVNYECVGDYKWMPKLNSANPATQDYLVSIALYWLQQGADGWRLDVGDELAASFRRKLRQQIKRSYPNALILAETWRDGEELLKGDQADTLMNYRLRDALIDFLAAKTIGKEEFEERISSVYFDYQKASHGVLYNLIDSHDTERFLTTVHGDKRLLKLAAAFQFLLPGMPVLFYGDEIGMEGDNDPGCRAGMKWDSIDVELLTFYQNLITLHQSHEALRKGDFVFLKSPGKTVVFLRQSPEETLLVAINPSSEKETISSLEIADSLLFKAAPLSLEVAPFEYRVEMLS